MANITEEDAMRYRDEYRGENIYTVVVFDPDGFPCGLSLNQTMAGECNLQTITGLEFVAELVSCVMARPGGVNEVVDIARRCSGGSRTLPGIIAKRLGEYV